MKFDLTSVRKFSRILFWSSLVGLGAFYFQTVRPRINANKRAEQEKIAEEIFKVRYPELAAVRQEAKTSKTEEINQ